MISSPSRGGESATLTGERARRHGARCAARFAKVPGRTATAAARLFGQAFCPHMQRRHAVAAPGRHHRRRPRPAPPAADPPRPPATCRRARLLGVDEEASFEEVQDARNYLYEV
jgi:hypothetical protein